jgi:hypothetical protein
VKSVFPKVANKPHHPGVVAWNKAIKGYQGLLATTRRLAHHPTTVRMFHMSGAFGDAPFGAVPFGGGPTAFSWVESHMSDHEKLRGKAGANLPPLRLEDLKGHYEAVGGVADRLLGYPIDTLTKQLEGPSPRLGRGSSP